MKTSPHRPTKAVISLEAIAYNIGQVASRLPDKTLKMAVVKANAYGHGAVAVSHYIQGIVDAFGVSNIDEALELRESGITKEILVLGVTAYAAVSLAQEHDICLTVASLDWVQELLSMGQSLEGLRVHLKVDSGMGRIGFRSATEIQQAQRALQAQGVEVEGLFTHFATADEVDASYFEEQGQRFINLLEELEEVPALVHASNSATSIWHPETVLNMVRLGNIIYGMNPSGRTLEIPFEIKAALSLESELVHVKKIASQQGVGYGKTYVSQEEEYIGTLPLGYADGWTRDMQDFEVLVDGVFCPIVGRVSMDQLTIRLPEAYPIGTKVTLIGSSGQERIDVTQVAEYRGTINYEVVCLLSDRIPRVYRK
ncbi:alanine racemase [Streptococcus sp. 121]|uniref:alanine racemase n=1 Tax=Streptococcus sp. 121 TaxID=2797637 RepID=UPI0018F0A6CE|nr:alanine racemase [Streptococcus sp. 121]MBJ6746204.1 alanine racemase [Streptococcus sp. 121]